MKRFETIHDDVAADGAGVLVASIRLILASGDQTQCHPGDGDPWSCFAKAAGLE